MKQRKLNAAQHIWLAIMTELAIERLYASPGPLDTCLHRLCIKHQMAAGGVWEFIYPRWLSNAPR